MARRMATIAICTRCDKLKNFFMPSWEGGPFKNARACGLSKMMAANPLHGSGGEILCTCGTRPLVQCAAALVRESEFVLACPSCGSMVGARALLVRDNVWTCPMCP